MRRQGTPTMSGSKTNLYAKFLKAKVWRCMLDIPVFPPDETEIDDVCPVYESPEANDFTPESWDEYLLEPFLLPKGGTQQRGQVICRGKDHNG